jgi:hypothetical protein
VKQSYGSIKTLVNNRRNFTDYSDELLENNAGHKLRFISDNVRFESVENVTYFNSRSGEDLLRYVRGRLLDIVPVLIGCNYSINETQYVKQYPLAGSTRCGPILMNYIRSMVELVEEFDETTWTTVNAWIDY